MTIKRPETEHLKKDNTMTRKTNFLFKIINNANKFSDKSFLFFTFLNDALSIAAMFRSTDRLALSGIPKKIGKKVEKKGGKKVGKNQRKMMQEKIRGKSQNAGKLRRGSYKEVIRSEDGTVG